MSFPYHSLAMLGLLAFATPATANAIKVCADPNNLPFSDSHHAGFENRLVEELIPSIGSSVEYVWWDDRRATAIEALQRHLCDLVPGSLPDTPAVTSTSPYFRSGYAFVTREREAPISSFDDPALRAMTVAVQSIGDDASAPPAVALLKRGLGPNIRPYTFHGHRNDPDSAGAIVADVASGKVDAAVLWGPFASYFASRQAVSLRVTLVQPGPADLQMIFDIAMATRPDDTELRDALDAAIREKRAEISKILADYKVPEIDATTKALNAPERK